MANRLFIALAVAVAASLAVACDVKVNDKGVSFDINEGGRAEDEWSRTYTLSKGGRLELVAANGNVDIGPASGSEVAVQARREVRARNDEAAQQLLKQLRIDEEVTPDHVKLTSPERARGSRQNVRINYRLTVPPGLTVTARTENGGIRIDNVEGLLTVSSTNGEIFGRSLIGSFDATTVNGGVNVTFAALTGDVRMSTVNGAVVVALPEKVNATLDATTVNGGIVVRDDVPLVTTDRDRRHVSGRLGAGSGPRIELRVTNGGIRIGAPPPPR